VHAPSKYSRPICERKHTSLIFLVAVFSEGCVAPLTHLSAFRPLISFLINNERIVPYWSAAPSGSDRGYGLQYYPSPIPWKQAAE
jgi:hypothetical protein